MRLQFAFTNSVFGNFNRIKVLENTKHPNELKMQKESTGGVQQKGFVTNFVKFIAKHRFWNFFLNKLQA